MIRFGEMNCPPLSDILIFDRCGVEHFPKGGMFESRVTILSRCTERFAVDLLKPSNWEIFPTHVILDSLLYGPNNRSAQLQWRDTVATIDTNFLFSVTRDATDLHIGLRNVFKIPDPKLLYLYELIDYRDTATFTKCLRSYVCQGNFPGEGN
jgi:hypothetical protein